MKHIKKKWEVKNSGLISKPFEVTGCGVVVDDEDTARLISKVPEMFLYVLKDAVEIGRQDAQDILSSIYGREISWTEACNILKEIES